MKDEKDKSRSVFNCLTKNRVILQPMKIQIINCFCKLHTQTIFVIYFCLSRSYSTFAVNVLVLLVLVELNFGFQLL